MDPTLDEETGLPVKRKSVLRRLLTRKNILIFLLFCLLSLVITVGAIYISLPGVEHLKGKNPGTTAFIDYRKAQAKRQGKELVIRQEWISFKKFPKLLKEAVRLSEDAGFYGHSGIDFIELEESIKKNVLEGRKARGGSTITMQLARNLFLSPRKSYLRKIKEIVLAGRLEKKLGKKRIFHLYLNIVELGYGVFGFPAAAKHFFKKSLDQLTLEQILRLVAVMPKPLRVKPTDNSRYIKWRMKIIAQRLYRTGVVNIGEFEKIMELYNKR